MPNLPVVPVELLNEVSRVSIAPVVLLLFTVTVVEVTQPMDEDHYIQWIAHVHDNRVCRVDLKPGDAPVAKFAYKAGATIYAMCNKHGLWKADVQ